MRYAGAAITQATPAGGSRDTNRTSYPSARTLPLL